MIELLTPFNYNVIDLATDICPISVSFWPLYPWLHIRDMEVRILSLPTLFPMHECFASVYVCSSVECLAIRCPLPGSGDNFVLPC